ncbi:glycosyl hydrolase 53 family protein [Reichenbachiella ulvae]|uniref:Glycosyl hydrolase 53 family protein n=1 Tax=Reichenbachiella ulvae TaxID=2980104 RepID=A0ABT3CW79_9BACT|nr:glycosyl hydrolase 53 family protein [Reichenbachiella ulvae]MCV9387774.1 glycosyl hydrolase 53 family protein [Reichenbachiella ulvae]
MRSIFYLLSLVLILCSCQDDESSDHKQETNRPYKMGFSTWSFGPELADLEATYQFISSNADIYSEQVDNKIPWNAYIDNQPPPEPLVTDINARVARRLANHNLMLSVSLLNLDRTGLLEGFDGTTPYVATMDDPLIIKAYSDHLLYLLDLLQPDYLVMAMEVNELMIHDPMLWTEYLSLMKAVRANIKAKYPNLKTSESVTLHNWYGKDAAIDEAITNFVNQQDFAAISFYPFFVGLHTAADFQRAFDFLHERVTVPIAFVETNHLAEDLVIPNLSVDISSNETEQANYLTSLLQNAEEHSYPFVIWWGHRDYDALWETFPEEVKDVGQIWRDTGLLDENGNERPAYQVWVEALDFE